MSRKRKAHKREAALKPRQPELLQRERREPLARALPRRWSSALASILIAVVTLAAFLPALQNQFVNWDDADNFLDNPHYRGLGWSQLLWMWTAFHMGHWIPLTWMTLGLDYVIWGMNPFGYHLTSLVLHAANAIVFYFVALRILGLALPDPSDRGRAGLALAAGFAALLFALHPLRVESVAWATERRDVLSGLFYLLTILVYLRACERGERGRGWYWGAVGLFACALLSKSITVSLPVVLLILDVYPLRRLGGTIGWWSEPARRVYLEKIPFILLAGGASTIAFLALSRDKMWGLDQLSVPGRLAISAHNLSFYLWKTVLPLNLSPLYELRAVNAWAPPFLLGYGVVLAVSALALALRHRVWGLPAAWLAYVIILLPVLGIFQNGLQVAADRYTYLACLGWALLAAAGLHSASRRLPFLSTGLALVLLAGLGSLTFSQAQVWHDSEKLWSHAIAIDPRSPVAEYGRGSALAKQGKLAEAIDHYQQALHLKPDYAEADTNWGNALAQQGKVAEAIEHYQTTLRLKPDHAAAHANMGVELARQGKLAEAIEHYQTALRLKPYYAEAHFNWGNALAQQGKVAEAIEQALRLALRLKPDYAAAHGNMDAELAQQGKLAEAIEHYQTALRLKPDFADAHFNWGNALAKQGKLAEAIAHYQQALQIRPDYAEARANLLQAEHALGMGKEDAAHSR